MCQLRARGFTLTELLVVIAVIALLSVVLVVSFKNINEHSALRISVQEVETALLSARNRTLASENDTVFGVHIDTDQVVEFNGPDYASSPATTTYSFSDDVTATSSLSGGATNIVFERLTGNASATGTITIVSSEQNASTTITVHRSGLIERK